METLLHIFSETWILKKTDRDRILALEMYCYRRILHLRWTQKISNKQIRERLKIREDLVQVVMRRKLNLFGHIIRMDGRRERGSVMIGIMEGNQRRGRPCREWLDDIGDWCQEKIHTLSTVSRNYPMHTSLSVSSHPGLMPGISPGLSVVSLFTFCVIIILY